MKIVEHLFDRKKRSICLLAPFLRAGQTDQTSPLSRKAAPVPSIHPTAVVSPSAEIGRDVAIGPMCILEEGVRVGDGCRLAARVTVKAGTTLGPRNEVCEGAVLGGTPQHLRCPEKIGELVVGSGNILREYVTVHRSLHPGQETRIGDQNMLMVNVHVAHDCVLGNNTILANNVMLAGHVTVGDRAFVSGAVGVHQFCRIGAYAMVGGQAHINRDVPPYVTVDGDSTRIVGLNMIGLKRNGFSAADLAALKEAYRLIYRQGLSWNQTLAALEAEFPTGPASAFAPFFRAGKRGFVPERRVPPAATIKLRTDDATDREEATKAIRKAG